jgi:threonine/homoserine/homoserine lactone efflux protein
VIDGTSPLLAGLGLGVALAGAPGPVQAMLLAESLRGGVGRGLRALAGANLSFGALLIGTALGLTVVVPNDAALRVLKIGGGIFLIWLGYDGFRSRDDSSLSKGDPSLTRDDAAGLPLPARGALMVVLNPAAWLFLATAASSLFATATQQGGRAAAVGAALALMVGVGAGDAAVVLAGGTGLRRAGPDVARLLRRALALVLVVFGLWLIFLQ